MNYIIGTFRITRINIKLFLILSSLFISFQPHTLYSQDLDTVEIRQIMVEGIENMDKGNYRSAIELFDRGRNALHTFVIGKDARKANIVESLQLTREAEERINREDFEGALELLNRAIELDNNNIEAYKFRGSVRLVLEQRIERRRNRDYNSLLNDYTNAIRITDNRINRTARRTQERRELEKEKAKILINRAYVKMQSRRRSSFYSAIDDYSDAISYDDQNWDGYHGRAIAHNKVGDSRREVNDYLRAVELMDKYDHPLTDRERAEIYLNIAYAYADIGNSLRAFTYAERSYNLGNNEAETIMDRNRP